MGERGVEDDSGEAVTAKGPDARQGAGVTEDVCSQSPPFHGFDKLRVCLRFHLKKDYTLEKNVASTDLIQSPNLLTMKQRPEKRKCVTQGLGLEVELGLELQSPEPGVCKGFLGKAHA